MRSFKILTFGCQMNERDSEKMTGVMAHEGYDEADGVDDADVIIVNTCSIREKAEQKFFSELGRLKRIKDEKPSVRIAVSGCIAQQEGKAILRRAPHVDFIFGNQNINDLPVLLDKGGVRTDFPHDYEHNVLPARRGGGVSAFVNIMYGCDNFCSYCVVPYVRGREKSRRPEDIISEMERLAEVGVREVTLLGQNVNSYGRTLKGDSGADFPHLLRMADSVSGIKRIRFVTSHPKDFTDRLIEAMADSPKVCENLHLPMQSASDRVLRAMNRGYTFGQYLDKIAMLRSAMPGISLSTDIIVGFPGETEEDYELTVKALEEIRYDSIFSFAYSRRPGTAALKLPGHIPEETKAARLERVIELQNGITLEKNTARVGMIEEVLVEGPDKNGGAGRLSGKTRGGKIVNFDGDASLVGKLVRVKIAEGKKHSLAGEMQH